MNKEHPFEKIFASCRGLALACLVVWGTSGDSVTGGDPPAVNAPSTVATAATAGTPWPQVQVAGVTVRRRPGAVLCDVAAGVVGEIKLPRFDNIVRRVWIADLAGEQSAATQAQPGQGSSDGTYDRPWIPTPQATVSLAQSSTEWILRPSNGAVAPFTIVMEVEDLPRLHDAEPVRPSVDGVVTLPAHRARVAHAEGTGPVSPSNKLQYEPLPHKNTVGYWVDAADFASWRFQLADPGEYEVHILQGCGGGQGGSQAEIAIAPQVNGSAIAVPPADAQRVPFEVEETGHFQNFRWRKIGTVALAAPQEDHELVLTLRCLKKAKAAVMDMRQIRLIPAAIAVAQEKSSTEPRPLTEVEPDLWVPPLTAGAPSAGRRCLTTATSFETTRAYHSVWLPTDWQSQKSYPLLVEFTGNGGYRNPLGDICTGRVEDASLGYGISGGDGAIWLSVPYLNAEGTANLTNWWGVDQQGAPTPTLKYLRAAIADAVKLWGADPQRVTLIGFSRGAIAVNAIGLHDTPTAQLWQRGVCFSHYDGLRRWPVGGDAEAAKARLANLGEHLQFICSEDPQQIAETRLWLTAHAATAVPRCQFAATGFRNHNDAWTLRPSPVRTAIRTWLSMPAP